MPCNIIFVNGKIRRLCEDAAHARKKLGDRCAKLLIQRMGEIRSSDNLAILKTLPGPRCHGLHGDRHGQYGLDLEHPRRLIILPTNGKDQTGTIKEELVTEVMVVEIIDYH